MEWRKAGEKVPIAHPLGSLASYLGLLYGCSSSCPHRFITSFLCDQKFCSVISRAFLSRENLIVPLRRSRLCMTKDVDFVSFAQLFLKKEFSGFLKHYSTCLRTCTLTSISIYFDFFFFL